MNIIERIRIKRKIKKVCRIIDVLHKEDRPYYSNMIINAMHTTNDRNRKEHLLDMIIEGCGEYVNPVHRQ